MNHQTITYPQCQSQKIVKNGSTHNKKSKYKYTEWGRRFVENHSQIYISEDTKNLIDKLLLEKISLAGIARTTGVSRKWLQDYVNAKYKIGNVQCVIQILGQLTHKFFLGKGTNL